MLSASATPSVREDVQAVTALLGPTKACRAQLANLEVDDQVAGAVPRQLLRGQGRTWSCVVVDVLLTQAVRPRNAT